MNIRTVLKLLLGLAIGLPLFQSLLVWVAGLLSAMGDKDAAHVIGRVSVEIGIVWLASLVSLVVALALKAINEPIAVNDEIDEPPL